MATGRSLHVALNSVDASAYGGWSGDLLACEFDADDMRQICQSKGFATSSLITREATSQAVLAAIDEAAAALGAGDLFVVTYSGHGGQMPDVGGEERDRKDETWVLYDRQVLDDELYQRWASFAEGVRIVVVSDSCHSGSVVKAQLGDSSGSAGELLRGAVAHGRYMPFDANQRDNEDRRAMYDAVRAATPSEGQAQLAARVLLLSGCQDNQTSSDGDRNGAFTGALREVWADGAFKGGYRRFLTDIRRKLPPWQTPNYMTLNDPTRQFSAERPFIV